MGIADHPGPTYSILRVAKSSLFCYIGSIMVEDAGERRKTHIGHRPTFTRLHTVEETDKISNATKGKPKPGGTLSEKNIEGIRRGMTEYWKRRWAREAQEAQNAAGEVTIFTPDTNKE
jgi:hypothetical protein